MKKLLVLIVVATIFAGCKKEKPNDSKVTSYKLAPNTVLIDEPTGQTLVTLDTTKIVFNGNTLQLRELKQGDIVISGITPTAPYGYFRKILGVQKSGSQYTFTTEDAVFTEAFENLKVNYEKSFAVSDTLSGKKESLQFAVDFFNKVIYDKDGNSNTVYDQVTLNGSVSFTPSIFTQIDIQGFKLNYAKMGANLETNIQSTLTVGGNISSINKEITIYTQPLAPFMIPLTPIVIVPYLSVNIGVDGSVNVSVTSSYSNSNNISAYIEYQNNVWNKGSSRSMENSYTFSGISANASLKGYVEPSIDLSFYGLRGATASIITQGFLKLEASIPPPQCNLKAGVSAGVEAKLKILGLSLAEVSYPEIFTFEKSLFSCSPDTSQKPKPIADFIASKTIVNIGETVYFTDKSLKAPTSWLWNFQGGSPSSSTSQNPSTTYNLAGVFDVSLRSTNANGNDVKVKSGYITVIDPMDSTPISNFITTDTSITVGQSVTFTNLSLNATSFLWNFSGGFPSSSTSNNPTITYSTVGVYDVSLTASNIHGNDTETKQSYIKVSSPTSTSCGSVTSVKDADGNTYPTVTIGNQCWIKENLKTSKYADGSPIANIANNSAWVSASVGAWCWYKDSSKYDPIYGRLYNWAAVNDSRNICPTGWHIPSKAEWEELIDYVGGKNVAAGHLKEEGITHWNFDSGADNSSGFTALPGGGRSENGGGFVILEGNTGCWWSNTTDPTLNSRAFQLEISTNNNYLAYPLLTKGKTAGLSVRCLKD